MTSTVRQAPPMATFAMLVKSRFRLSVDPDTSVEVELAEFRQGPSAVGFEQFSLLFQGPADAPREQRMYQLEQEATGSFELFLVPVGLNETGLLYEAVFSQRREHIAGGN